MNKPQPNITRIYHVPDQGMVLEHVHSKPAKRHKLTTAEKCLLDEIKRRKGFHEKSGTKNSPTNREVSRKGAKWAQSKRKGAKSSNARNKGRR